MYCGPCVKNSRLENSVATRPYILPKLSAFPSYVSVFSRYRDTFVSFACVFPMIPTKPWHIEKRKTKEFLQKNGYPVRNFVTHLPIWFDWDKLEEMFDKYDMDNNSYIVEDLYFNIYYPTRIPAPLHIDHDNFKCGVYRPNPRIEYIKRAFKEKIWIQNSVEGWIPALEAMLAKYYGI